ncbi:MAG: hypothetical protein A2745_02595 [Candidatus Harrisonbacteria bacterium RIFCSPHIGHO2_01_FULL_44_13]|uniref:Type II secretion system protein GspF domain-containing protein n=1 Tax=Candidatus Harrisonbacteria bacterium RIFCSPLOWO2_01_FULL_44_18 TaxID=1798407 RepID=A0A1G1ZP04_9BACT|nr:MAG: hypothetical protein A2745_02595 [Candidatus Harrisonbacteria bacterium RIFCSPHIGHO2_01_FULL_44_13]OGY66302.1 MAG: hypothetical protein A3A16_00115 [Candidatus Harrisonbacteria bacterium RIFCSPLOWO2_01_FULL_44_18]
MRFHYVASQPNGEIIEGNIDAQGTADVLTFLATKGLKPVSIQQVKGLEQRMPRRFWGQAISVVDKVFLTKYLSLMLGVGTDLFRALDILIADFKKPVLRELLIEIKTDLERGQPFYSTFARYPKFFSPVFVNLVKAGEASGNLETVFENLSQSLEKEMNLRNRIRSALIYPVLLLTVSVLILIFLITFALPRIAGIFLGSGFAPPLFSRVVFGIGLFIGNYLLPILISLALLIIGGWYFATRNKIGRRLLSQFINHVPLVKDVLHKIALQRFALTLSSLMKAGLPIVDALEITADAVDKEDLRLSLKRIAREGVTRGLTLGEAFRKEAVFPATVSNLIAISEKAGHIDEILQTFAEFYESEIDSTVKAMVSFIEPVMLLFIGGVIGIIALSIIVPIYQLVGQF